MNSRPVKRGRMSGAVGTVLFALAALVGGCSSADCAMYGCANPVTLTGSVIVPKQVTIVDFRFCAEKKCNEGSLDLADGNARMPCASWDFTGARVCLTKASEPESFALRAEFFPFPEYENPPDVAVQLTLTDHATGGVVLDETRIAKARTERTDNCHACWSAEATL
jgi:hypothetical protein